MPCDYCKGAEADCPYCAGWDASIMARALGSKGGKAGKGAAKRRSAEHYQLMARRSAAVRAKKSTGVSK